MSKKEEEFKFFDKEQEDNNIAQQKEKKEKHKKFLKIGKHLLVAGMLVSTVGGMGAIGNYIYQHHVDKQIQEIETDIYKMNKSGMFNLLEQEKTATRDYYTQNLLLIDSFANYKDVINVVNYGDNIALFNANNAKLYNQINQQLNFDKSEMERVFGVLSSSRENKIKEFTDFPDDLKKVKEWDSNYKNKQFMYVGNLIKLNKNLKDSKDFLEATQIEIIKNVNEKLKNKQYDLNQAQIGFTNQVSQESQQQIKDLQQAKSELDHTVSLLQENDENDEAQKIKNVLTDKDIQDASKSIEEIKKEANDKILSDKAKVESLIAATSSNQNNNENKATPTNNGNNQIISVNHGASFMDYYLMYIWMNNINNTSASSNLINQKDNRNNNNQSYYVGGSVYNPSNSLLKTNAPYSIKNENSYLNKSFTQKAHIENIKSSLNKSSLAKNMDLNALRSQIQTTKTKAEQVKTVRNTVLTKTNYANSYEAGKTGTKGTVSKTSISRGIFGGRSAGFGG